MTIRTAIRRTIRASVMLAITPILAIILTIGVSIDWIMEEPFEESPAKPIIKWWWSYLTFKK